MLKAKLAGDRLVMTTDDDDAARLGQLAARIPGARDVAVDGGHVEARVGDGPAALPELMRAAGDAGVHVGTAQVHRPTLDDVFLTLTGHAAEESDDPTTKKEKKGRRS